MRASRPRVGAARALWSEGAKNIKEGGKKKKKKKKKGEFSHSFRIWHTTSGAAAARDLHRPLQWGERGVAVSGKSVINQRRIIDLAAAVATVHQLASGEPQRAAGSTSGPKEGVDPRRKVRDIPGSLLK